MEPHTAQPIPPLTWSLMIATYQRHTILKECLRLAAGQTRPPSEVVVVDASPNFEEGRRDVLASFEHHAPHIPIRYERASRAATTTQRNQGISLCQHDVVFLIDDDSLMYRDCAERIMEIYEKDTAQTVVGVSAISVEEPPPELKSDGEGLEKTPSPRQTILRRAVKRLLRTDKTDFVPYDLTFPEHHLSASLREAGAGVIPYMTGHAMTFRRRAFEQEHFCELLDRYAVGEDQDLSYRLSRHGALVNATRARLCHMASPGGRVSPFTVGALAVLNPVVLHRLYSSNPAVSRRRLWKRTLHMLPVNGLKELSARRWSLPRTRGIAFATLWFPKIWRSDPEELGPWFVEFQQRLIAGWPRSARPHG